MQRSKRIGRDFGSGMRNSGEQSRFACVRIADEADLGNDTQFQKEIAFIAGFAGLGKTRRLARCRGKVAISQAATPAFAKDESLTVRDQIGDQLSFWFRPAGPWLIGFR